MKTTNFIAFIAVLCFGLFENLIAQGAPSIVSGTRIRVSVPSFSRDRLIGTVALKSADTLLLTVNHANAPVIIPLVAVTRLDVSRGRKSKVGTGAAIGFITGATTGAVLFEAFCREHDCTTQEMLAVAALGGATLAGVGALIGAFIRVDRWETVPIEKIRFGLAPHDGGLALSASVTF